MRGTSILCSFLLAGCAASNSGGGENPLPEAGDVLKVTYIRFNLDPKTRKYVPEYRVMISSSWRARFGDVSNEPFAKIFRMRGTRAPFFGEVPDDRMHTLFGELKRKGIENLRDVPPEEIDLVGLSQVEKNQADAPFTRLITIGGEKWHKSYTFRGNNATEATIKGFVACEKEVIKMAVQYTAQVSTGAEPFIPKD